MRRSNTSLLSSLYYSHRKVIYLRLRIALTLCAIDYQQNGPFIKRANYEELDRQFSASRAMMMRH